MKKYSCIVFLNYRVPERPSDNVIDIGSRYFLEQNHPNHSNHTNHSSDGGNLKKRVNGKMSYQVLNWNLLLAIGIKIL